MKIICNLGSGVKYDKRHLQQSRSGTRFYPSKKMFVEFLKQYKDVKGTADIWSENNWTDSTTTIHVDLIYKVPNMPNERKSRSKNKGKQLSPEERK